MSVNSFNFSGQTQDPEIVRENFNKIARWLTNSDATVMRLQSQVADISSLGANATIRNFTVFMQSDTDVCEVIIYDPQIFALSVIDRRDTLWFFKGVSGASTKTISVISGTIEGSTSITIANGQTICIQSNGEEYKILFDSNSSGGGSILLQVNDVDNVDQTLLDLVDSDTITFEDLGAGQVTAHSSGSGTPDLQSVVDVGNTIDKNINIIANSNNAGFNATDISGSSIITSADAESGYVGIFNVSGFDAYIHAGLVTDTRNFELPDNAGTVAAVAMTDDYPNDAAAAAGTPIIPIGGFYHTSGAVKIRLT